MAVKEELKNLSDKINENPEHIEGLDYVYQFQVSGEDEGAYQVAFSNGELSYNEGEAEDPSCTIQLSGENLVKLIHGKLNATSAFMMGQLKIKGDLSLALKLQSILQKYQ
ncbi:SCP2 sterol-binding domain-containing protein [Cytobacillus sp. Hm23]|uniref:SCP2 sterol-binding domain-containing protein n=1 Tax=Cytobacillus sp. IB215665 TaxID=3097357 RepID=UPI002A0BAB10|nr:SCP2 sterol-binding domain-containing protein [Cytobacillus sp. IB215665]MDX8364561.1 SCP2 sterol-binding domain-containing protein [Cytobacillus sp. IB215665]